MMTARLEGIERFPRNNITYADARLSNGAKVTGVGFRSSADPTGKYDALWDLAQVLTKLGVEVEA